MSSVMGTSCDREGCTEQGPHTHDGRLAMLHPDPVVWLVNKGGHDYSSLDKWGRVIPMTTGSINPFNPDRLMVSLGHHISMAKKEDYIVISGLPIINMLVLVLWLEKFPEARLLQWSVRSDKYVFAAIKKAAVLRNLEDGKGP